MGTEKNAGESVLTIFVSDTQAWRSVEPSTEQTGMDVGHCILSFWLASLAPVAK